MNRQGTNRKQIKSPGISGMKNSIMQDCKEFTPWAVGLLKKKPYLLKATFAGTIEAVVNYIHQRAKDRRGHAPMLKNLSFMK